MMVRVLVVDDDPEIVDLLRLDFELMGYDVDSATNGLDGLKKAQSVVYDLVLLDVMMPKMDGFEVCRKIRASDDRHGKMPIILLTAKGLLEDKVRGFTAGADDYMVKPFDFQELMVRMRALFRRSGISTKMGGGGGSSGKPSPTSGEPSSHRGAGERRDEITSAGQIRLLTSSLEAVVAGQLVKLTPTEFEILYCLMQHINEAVSLTTILKEVWGYDVDEDVRMVRVHIGGLRQKIEPDPKTPRFLKTVTNVGYRLFAEPQE
jgi:two-component system, OmpR family, response regulator RpaA